MVDWNDAEQACAEYRRLDERFGTDPMSPLHHDNRCELHAHPFILEHIVVVSVP